MSQGIRGPTVTGDVCDDSDAIAGLAARGDRPAFEELYRRYYGPIARRIAHMVGPEGPRSDLVQETFVLAYRNIHTYRGDAAIGHWLLRIASNVSHTYFRRTRRLPWMLWDRPDQEDRIESGTRSVDEVFPCLQAVHSALRALSPRLREAVLLFEMEGLSLTEMAEQLGLPLNTVASRVRRGRAQLKGSLLRLGFSTANPRAQAVVP